MTEKIYCIFGAGEYGAELRLPEDPFVTAADAGYLYLTEKGVTPDLIVGDFDSLGSVPDFPSVTVLPVKKDDTDTLFAVRDGFERGFDTFYIYGGLGGNLDHTLANIQVLSFIAENGGKGLLLGKDSDVCIIKDSTLRFPLGYKGRISVFAFGSAAHGVTEKGLEYELDDASLTPSFPLGVSNSFMGAEAEISVKNGSLCIVWDCAPELPLPKII